MKDISEKDKEILYQLDLNSRKPLKSIAKKVNLPENTLRYRIKKLEESNIITRYYTVINSYNLGYNVIKFYAKYININSTIKKEIIEFFTHMPTTWVVGSTEGKFDIGVIFWMKNINDFYPIWKEIFCKYPNNFIDTILFFQCEALSLRPTYLINTTKRSENEYYDITRQNRMVTIDAIDSRILEVLACDAKIPTVQLAKKLKISTGLVNNRIKKLKKNGIIQSYRIEINASKIGYINIKADIFLTNLNEIPKVISYFKQCPHVLCIMKSVGYSHIEIEFNVKTVTQFHQIMTEFIDQHPNLINKYNYFQTEISHKLSWIPAMKQIKKR